MVYSNQTENREDMWYDDIYATFRVVAWIIWWVVLKKNMSCEAKCIKICQEESHIIYTDNAPSHSMN